MNRIRFKTRPGAEPEAVLEELPSGRLQFGAPQAEPELEPLSDDVEALVESRLRQATQEGEAAGALDFDALEAEFDDTGRLSEESYALLAAAGLPRRIVDRYIEGQRVAGEKLVKEAEEIAGGPERLRAAQLWAETALPPEQTAAYHAALEAGPEQAKFAVEGLCAAHRRATGQAPRLTRGEAGRPDDGAFASAADVSRAIRDPRYKSDPAYRAKVAARLARSRIF